MGYELLNDFGDTYQDEDWQSFQDELVIRYLKLLCGEPPLGLYFDSVGQDHDFGPYSQLGLRWDEPGAELDKEGWEYVTA